MLTMKEDSKVRELLEKTVSEYPRTKNARDMLYYMSGYLGIEESREKIDAGAFLAEFCNAVERGVIEWR